MVYLSKIYTRAGDDGFTTLGDGTRVGKDHSRVEAYGEVDELNATLGLLLSLTEDFPEKELIREICNDLFDVGADLCVPEGPDEKPGSVLRITEGHVTKLEQAIDRLNAELAPLHSFILPGGLPAAAWCHLARTTCRRAERRTVTLAHGVYVNPQALIYLNRLSDLLFVLGRHLNDKGKRDVLWQPGMGRRQPDLE